MYTLLIYFNVRASFQHLLLFLLYSVLSNVLVWTFRSIFCNVHNDKDTIDHHSVGVTSWKTKGGINHCNRAVFFLNVSYSKTAGGVRITLIVGKKRVIHSTKHAFYLHNFLLLSYTRLIEMVWNLWPVLKGGKIFQRCKISAL